MHPKTAAFADVADVYERGRPGYPPSLLDLLHLRPGVDVLDLAAGTGKLTRLLVSSGAAVTAVEPLPKLRARLPEDAIVVDGVAEAIPLPEESFDVATVGEAWHWFDHAKAAAELARVVRPGGTVALIWQEPDPEQVPDWGHAAWELIRGHRGDHPAFGAGEAGRTVFADHPDFTPLELHRLEHRHHTDHDGVLAEAASVSYIASLDGHDRATLLAQLAEIVPLGDIVQQYRTDVYLSRRRTPGS
jgi:SAM-dependent methyltransferase